MTFPIQSTFRGMEASPALEETIRSKAASLEKYYDRIMRCRVAVEAPSQHHRHGMGYQVTVELSVPGQEIVAKHEPGELAAHEDAHVAVRDAFRVVRDELKTYVGRLREQVKHGARIAEELER